MSVRVYKFGCDAPFDTALVVAQLRAAHDYKNELTAIERGRRDAMRLLYDTPEIRDAEAALKTATKTDRAAAKRALYTLRRETLETQRDDAKRIHALAHELHLGARALTSCFWGSYLDVESAAQQARSAPLYDDDGLTPSQPRFLRWRDPMQGQLAVQLQSRNGKPFTTADILAARSTFVRVVREDGARPNVDAKWVTLMLRVGSDGRDPIWARVRMCMHRAIPDAAKWKWVRLSCRPRELRDHLRREDWSVEITVDDPAPPARSLDTTLDGAIAISWSWDVLSDESVRVASYVDTSGRCGDIVVPARMMRAIKKPADIRAVRDLLWNDAQPKIARALKRSKEPLPKWLSDAANIMHLWRSLARVHELGRRLRAEKLTGVDKNGLLAVWEKRDLHLHDYERNVRDQSLGQRREWYRLHACWMARSYRHVLYSNHDLSREARFGDESDVRFAVSPDQLRGAIKNALGEDAIETRWDRDEEWCERACAAYLSGGARGDMFVERKEKVTNAWASRKAKKLETATARNEAATGAE